ncbi:hypothetical protein B296_00018812 [Ensete ventricosum]|uniref:Uncharacterized protein n=1 Tax=Ensete ventricosum TaxID=4639 RepID=A0A426YV11_ENSVE|nr:hypothetical protein B296_00018812 [Ensete ventricosum]
MNRLGWRWIMGIGYNSCVLRLEGCPKDNVIGGSKNGRVLVCCEKKNDKSKVLLTTSREIRTQPCWSPIKPVLLKSALSSRLKFPELREPGLQLLISLGVSWKNLS